MCDLCGLSAGDLHVGATFQLYYRRELIAYTGIKDMQRQARAVNQPGHAIMMTSGLTVRFHAACMHIYFIAASSCKMHYL
jgi:hypothetical protein